jgi:hypothetical protein
MSGSIIHDDGRVHTNDAYSDQLLVYYNYVLTHVNEIFYFYVKASGGVFVETSGSNET